MNYYTYAYLREDGTPYYIGKGKGNRIHSKNGRVFLPPPKERRIYLKQNLTEEEAFKHEVYVISILGRKDLGTGILQNKSNEGKKLSEQHRTNKSEASKLWWKKRKESQSNGN
jgi:hypothetical protein